MRCSLSSSINIEIFHSSSWWWEKEAFLFVSSKSKTIAAELTHNRHTVSDCRPQMRGYLWRTHETTSETLLERHRGTDCNVDITEPTSHTITTHTYANCRFHHSAQTPQIPIDETFLLVAECMKGFTTSAAGPGDHVDCCRSRKKRLSFRAIPHTCWLQSDWLPRSRSPIWDIGRPYAMRAAALHHSGPAASLASSPCRLPKGEHFAARQIPRQLTETHIANNRRN